MAFVRPPRPIGNYLLSSGGIETDRFITSGMQASFGGEGNDFLSFAPTTYLNGRYLIPFNIGGAGSDTYIINNGDKGLIYDVGGGYDKVYLETNISDVVFAWVNSNHILGFDIKHDTRILLIDPFGRENSSNVLDHYYFNDGEYSSTEIEARANRGSGLLGWTSWQLLDDSGYFDFSLAGLTPSRVDDYKYNAYYNDQFAVGGPTNYDIVKGYEYLGTASNDTLSSYLGDNDYGHDYMSGGAGNDTLYGYRGADELLGGAGSDELRAGNGRDTLTGGSDRDTLYGGFGLNTFTGEADGNIDSLYLKSDHLASNYIYGKAGNSPNGEKADIIGTLDSYDKIFIQGADTSQLSFGNVSHVSILNLGNTISGIGIYADGVLEAVYSGTNLSVSQVQAMTSGASA